MRSDGKQRQALDHFATIIVWPDRFDLDRSKQPRNHDQRAGSFGLARQFQTSRTNCLPMLPPRNTLASAAGAASIPTATVSRHFNLPSRYGLRRRVVSKPSPARGTAARRSRRTSNGCSSLSPLTLEEIWARLKREEKLEVAASSIWRFCDRHEITYEKSLHAAEQDRPDVAAARTELKAEQPKLKAPRLVFIDETAVTTKMVRHYGRAPLGERLVAKKVKVAIARKLNKRMLDEESEVKMSPARRLTSTRS